MPMYPNRHANWRSGLRRVSGVRKINDLKIFSQPFPRYQPSYRLAMPLRPAARLLARFTQAREFFTQLDLQPAVDRPVVGPLAHRVGETGLVQRDAAFGLVVVLVTLGVA